MFVLDRITWPRVDRFVFAFLVFGMAAVAVLAEQAIGAEDQFIHRETEAPAECQREVRTKLVHLLSKLNPAAKEFFPSNYTAAGGQKPEGRLSADAPVFVVASGFNGNGPTSNGGSSRDSSSDCSSNNQPNNRVISLP